MIYKGKMMFKKIMIVAAVLMSAIASTHAADMKVGVFDEQLVLSKIPQVNLIQANLQAKFKDRSDELKAIRETAKKQTDDYQRDAMTMTAAQRIDKEREIKKMRADYTLKENNLKEDFERAQQEEVRKIRIKIQQTVAKLAADEKYDVVLRREAVAFRKDTLDISNKLITILSNPAG